MAERLTDEEVAARLLSLPGWEVRESTLTRTFRFDDFMGAIGFVNRVAPIAEVAGHHPDLEVGWGRVVVELTTHDAGGLTARDFEVAAQIDRV